jgi:GT2 family glycosyltransferase
LSAQIAIVVVSRNRARELAQTLPRHLSLPERPRVVLVDDASTDGTADMVRSRFPPVEVIAMTRWRGAVARNVGLHAVPEPYVAFCDDDAWFEPGALQRAVEVLNAHPRLAVVSPRILVGAQHRLDPVCEEMARSPLPAAPGQPGHPLLGFLACAVAVRRAAVLDVGGFCERLKVGAEEKLLSWDLAAAGWQMSYLPDLVAHHCPPVHARRPRRQAQTLRNDLWVNWLRRPPAAAMRATLRELRRTRADGVRLRAVAEAAAGGAWVVRERARCPPRVERLISLLEDGAG